VIDSQKQSSSMIMLGSYFAAFYAAQDYLLVASGEGLLRLSSRGEVMWRASGLGIDGVLVSMVEDSLVKGDGEWDPPGGWRPFVLRLDSGEMLGEMKAWNWVFPTGAILTVGGVFLYALVEHLSFGGTEGLGYATLSKSFFPALLVGTVLAIVGSFIDRKRLPVAATRARGVFCWAASAVSFLLLVTIGNVHGWTFTFIFPAFVGLIAGSVFLSKLTHSAST